MALTAAENEFIAEETLITVTSNIDHSAFEFISGLFGPLEAGVPIDIPLWLAITLRKKGKCTIQPPEWMSVNTLETIISNERNSSEFQPVPYHYLEISRLLLRHAKDDIAAPDKVATLLQDLENIRMDRLKIGMVTVAGDVKDGSMILSISLNNISAMETLAIKRFFGESMSVFRRLTSAQSTNLAGDGRIYHDGGDNDDINDAAPAAGARKLRKFRKN